MPLVDLGEQRGTRVWAQAAGSLYNRTKNADLQKFLGQYIAVQVSTFSISLALVLNLDAV